MPASGRVLKFGHSSFVVLVSLRWPVEPLSEALQLNFSFSYSGEKFPLPQDVSLRSPPKQIPFVAYIFYVIPPQSSQMKTDLISNLVDNEKHLEALLHSVLLVLKDFHTNFLLHSAVQSRHSTTTHHVAVIMGFNQKEI